MLLIDCISIEGILEKWDDWYLTAGWLIGEFDITKDTFKYHDGELWWLWTKLLDNDS